jgi:hypothetical protein
MKTHLSFLAPMGTHQEEIRAPARPPEQLDLRRVRIETNHAEHSEVQKVLGASLVIMPHLRGMYAPLVSEVSLTREQMENVMLLLGSARVQVAPEIPVQTEKPPKPYGGGHGPRSNYHNSFEVLGPGGI